MSSLFFFGSFRENFGGRNQLLKSHSVNQKAMNGISESLQWRFRGIQGVKHHVAISSYSFCASLFNILLWVRSEQCQSIVHNFWLQSMFYNCLLWKGNSPNDLSFSLCKSICGKIREIIRQSLLSLRCPTVAANKTKLSSICFCWESFNNRKVLNITPMNINYSQRFANGLNHLCFLTIVQLPVIIIVGNHVSSNVLRP